MQKVSFFLAVVVGSMTLSSPVFADEASPSNQELLQRIESLEDRVAALEGQSASASESTEAMTENNEDTSFLTTDPWIELDLQDLSLRFNTDGTGDYDDYPFTWSYNDGVAHAVSTDDGSTVDFTFDSEDGFDKLLAEEDGETVAFIHSNQFDDLQTNPAIAKYGAFYSEIKQINGNTEYGLTARDVFERNMGNHTNFESHYLNAPVTLIGPINGFLDAEDDEGHALEASIRVGGDNDDDYLWVPYWKIEATTDQIADLQKGDIVRVTGNISGVHDDNDKVDDRTKANLYISVYNIDGNGVTIEPYTGE